MRYAMVSNNDAGLRNAWCDSCDGCIGGARLFCLDCANKNTEVYDALDLCSRPECIAARITNREDLEGVHEPNHQLVKVRTVVLKRQHGRAYAAARKASERVEKFCNEIAEASEDLKTASNVTISSSSELAGGHDGDGPSTQNGTEGTLEATPPIQGDDLPTCGKCEGTLSFPFWYCTFCTGQSLGSSRSVSPKC